MQPIFDFINTHHGWSALIAFWVVSALVSGMPKPTQGSSVGYVWLYTSLHMLMANLQSLIKRKTGELPPDPDAAAVIFPVTTTTTGPVTIVSVPPVDTAQINEANQANKSASATEPVKE